MFVSCAKISYMAEQGLGQVALEWNGKSNKKVLADPKVSDEHKRKIRLVQKAKKYFYNYYGLKENSIYGQTTFLDQKAVSYLVIHSPEDHVKAKRSCFPIAGCFPYQGFFSHKSALEYVSQKESKGFQTYMRPVYAYSTLNHPLIPFSDNILSSFFHFRDNQLVHLIFHELVHTVLFVKDEIQFNENLAEFISDSMMVEYLKLEDNYVEKRRDLKERSRMINQSIVESAKKLEELYRLKKNSPAYTLRNFLKNHFEPLIKKTCIDYLIDDCWPLEGSWNNARFAAFRTYVAKQNELFNIYKDMNLNLKDFMLRLRDLEDEFDHDMSFIKFLKKKGKS
jgi:predicted aminopeptidase